MPTTHWFFRGLVTSYNYYTQGIVKSAKHCQAFEKDDEGVTDIAEVLVESIR